VARRVRLPGRRTPTPWGGRCGPASERSGATLSASSDTAGVLGCPARHHGDWSDTRLAHGRPVVVNTKPHVLVAMTVPASGRVPRAPVSDRLVMHACRHLEHRSSSRATQSPTKAPRRRSLVRSTPPPGAETTRARAIADSPIASMASTGRVPSSPGVGRVDSNQLQLGLSRAADTSPDPSRGALDSHRLEGPVTRKNVLRAPTGVPPRGGVGPKGSLPCTDQG